MVKKKMGDLVWRCVSKVVWLHLSRPINLSKLLHITYLSTMSLANVDITGLTKLNKLKLLMNGPPQVETIRTLTQLEELNVQKNNEIDTAALTYTFNPTDLSKSIV